MKTIKIYAIALAAAVLFAGCVRQKEFKPIERICVGNANDATVMKVSQDVLSGLHFETDKYDVSSGVIITKPLSGAQFFEFWRKDNVGSRNFEEANLQSIQRIAKLLFSRNEQGNMCVNCNVDVQRLNLPEREITGSISMSGLFTKSGSSRQNLKLYGGEKSWDDLGRDKELETAILQRIEKQIAQQRKGKNQ